MDFDNNLSPVEPKSKWAVFVLFVGAVMQNTETK